MTSQENPGAPRRRPSRLVPLALAGAVALACAGGLLFWRATQSAAGPKQGPVHKIVVGQNTCDPAGLTLAAGRVSFDITNGSDRTIEWEILDGVMVVGERENIAPGMHSALTVKLMPGSYDITCGLLSNPRGALVVRPSAQSEAERAAPPLADFVGPLSEFKVFLVRQSAELVTAVVALDAAIKAGDTAGARTAWLAARQPQSRIAAMTNRFADLGAAIDPASDYLQQREADPAFSGFHRIEYGLWGTGGSGGAGGIGDLAAVSARLVRDVSGLKDRLRGMRLAPADLADTAAAQARRLADGTIPGGADRWAGADLADLDANLDGLATALRLLEPLVTRADPAAAARIAAALAATRATLDGQKPGGAFPPYATVAADTRDALSRDFRALATEIDRVNPILGLE